MSKLPEYNATLIDVDSLHDELRIVRVKADDPEIGQAFQPGQYVEIGLHSGSGEDAKLIRRQYSVASAPGDPRGLELFIVLVTGGALTDPLWQLPTGARVWINPKLKGKFTLEEVPPGKNYIFIATGTGLAPFISMLRRYDADPPWKELALVHGVRLPQDLGYNEELQQLSRSRTDFKYIPCVSRDPDFPGLRGRITERLDDGSLEQALGRKIEPDADQILICGNPTMIDELVNSLLQRGFSLHKRKAPGNIHFERYW